jgi:hypothetical protein
LLQHKKGENQGLMTKILIRHKKSFIIFLFSIIFALSLVLANYLSLLIVNADVSASEFSSSEFEIYMLALSKSQVKNEVDAMTNDYRKIGAGGYIWENEGYYYLVSSAYSSKNDAELVQNSIKINQNLESEVFKVKFNTFSISGNFNAEEKKAILKSLSMAQDFYLSIYDIAISLDTGVYNEISAKLAVNSIASSTATTYANFTTLFPTPIEEPLLSIDSLCKNIVKIAQKLASSEKVSDSQTYSSLLKYRYLQTLYLYYEFIQ